MLDVLAIVQKNPTTSLSHKRDYVNVQAGVTGYRGEHKNSLQLPYTTDERLDGGH